MFGIGEREHQGEGIGTSEKERLSTIGDAIVSHCCPWSRTPGQQAMRHKHGNRSGPGASIGPRP